METLPTVTVKGQNGEPLRINEEDYLAAPDQWELVQIEQPPAAPQAVQNETPAAPPASMVVSKIGKRFFVTDPAKNKIVIEGIDSENGYDTDIDAWTAMAALGTSTQA